MKILFVCNMNQNRSPTAEKLFADRFETKSAGIYGGQKVTKELLEWADLIIVMEEMQRKIIAEDFPEEYLKKQIICIDIKDVYYPNHPELIKLLKKKMDKVLNQQLSPLLR